MYLTDQLVTNLFLTEQPIIHVPDHGSRDRDVVLVRRTASVGETWGVGNLEWGGNGEGEVSLRATWGQGGQDRITPKEGFQVSKREWKGS
jgi:hypothetical protein